MLPPGGVEADLRRAFVDCASTCRRPGTASSASDPSVGACPPKLHREERDCFRPRHVLRPCCTWPSGARPATLAPEEAPALRTDGPAVVVRSAAPPVDRIDLLSRCMSRCRIAKRPNCTAPKPEKALHRQHYLHVTAMRPHVDRRSWFRDRSRTLSGRCGRDGGSPSKTPPHVILGAGKDLMPVASGDELLSATLRAGLRCAPGRGLPRPRRQ